MDRDPATLLDIVLAARIVADHLVGRSPADLESDFLFHDALLYRIAVIGEASKRLSDAFLKAHPEIPWREIAGMRNRVIHGYDDVKLDRVWDVAWTHIPRLLALLEPLLPPEPKP